MSTTPQDLDGEAPALFGSTWPYRWLLVVGTLVGGLLGLALSAVQPVRYEGVG